jgi:hypothetical protein
MDIDGCLEPSQVRAFIEERQRMIGMIIATLMLRGHDKLTKGWPQSWDNLA